VKSEESETWMPLHPEAETALKDALRVRAVGEPGSALVFTGPHGGIIGSTLINDALAYGCEEAGLGYRVTAHGLRHSLANWLKTAGVPLRDIQATMRHRDLRTTARYLHTSDEEKGDAIGRLSGRPRPAA
jgi:integrase